jgi:Tfp pilus assembly protein PilF
LVHFQLGAALYAAGHVDAAVESLETALQFLPDLGEAHAILARIHRTRGDLVRAARHEGAARHAGQGRNRTAREAFATGR